MLDSVFGLPVHPLLVHATVVIVPSAALAVLVAALWPRFRRWAGWGPLALAVAGLVLDPLSTESGESLEHRIPETALVERHAELAEGLLPWLVLLALAALALYAYTWRERRATVDGDSSRATTTSTRWIALTLAVVSAVAAVGTSVQVALIGHSGAESAWHDVPASSSSADEGR